MSDHHHGPTEPEISFLYHAACTVTLVIFVTIAFPAIFGGYVPLGLALLGCACVAMVANAVPFFTRKSGSPGALVCGVVFPLAHALLMGVGMWTFTHRYPVPGLVCLFLVIPSVVGHLYALFRSWDNLRPIKDADDEDEGHDHTHEEALH